MGDRTTRQTRRARRCLGLDPQRRLGAASPRRPPGATDDIVVAVQWESHDRAASAATHFVDAGIGRDAVDPCPERAPPVEAADGAHHRKERFLGRIESIGVVAEHPPAQGVDAVVVRRQEELEGSAVTPSSPVEHLGFTAVPLLGWATYDKRLTVVHANGLAPPALEPGQPTEPTEATEPK